MRAAGLGIGPDDGESEQEQQRCRYPKELLHRATPFFEAGSPSGMYDPVAQRFIEAPVANCLAIMKSRRQNLENREIIEGASGCSSARIHGHLACRRRIFRHFLHYALKRASLPQSEDLVGPERLSALCRDLSRTSLSPAAHKTAGSRRLATIASGSQSSW